MPSNQPESLERFEKDFTVRWSCRPGDLIIWFRARNPFGSRGGFSFTDIWETKAGDFVTITDRWDDLPSGFYLHPTEVANALVDRWQMEFGSNWSEHERIDAPSLWRVGSGDRLAWLRPSRCHLSKPILKIMDMNACALVSAESTRSGWTPMCCAELGESCDSQAGKEACRLAVETVEKLGQPQSWSIEWSLG